MDSQSFGQSCKEASLEWPMYVCLCVCVLVRERTVGSRGRDKTTAASLHHRGPTQQSNHLLGNPWPLLLYLFFLLPSIFPPFFPFRLADRVTKRKKGMLPPLSGLFMNEGGLSLIVYLFLDFPWFCAAAYWEEHWLHNAQSFYALVLNCEGVRLGNSPLGHCMLLVPLLLSPLE